MKEAKKHYIATKLVRLAHEFAKTNKIPMDRIVMLMEPGHMVSVHDKTIYYLPGPHPPGPDFVRALAYLENFRRCKVHQVVCRQKVALD